MARLHRGKLKGGCLGKELNQEASNIFEAEKVIAEKKELVPEPTKYNHNTMPEQRSNQKPPKKNNL